MWYVSILYGPVFLPRPAYCCCRFTRLYINAQIPLTEPLKDMGTLTLLWIRCPSAGAEDSLNISVQYHYEAEIVVAHS